MCECTSSKSVPMKDVEQGTAGATVIGSIVTPSVPLAAPVDLTPNPEGPFPGPGLPGGNPELPIPGLPFPGPIIPNFKICGLDFRDGCYAMTFRPTGSFVSYEGTLRVDRAAPDGGPDSIIISGDLYTKLSVFTPLLESVPSTVSRPQAEVDGSSVTANAGPVSALATSSIAAAASLVATPLLPPLLRPRIPIFPRARYHSYLKITRVSVPIFTPANAICKVTLIAEQFNYTRPTAGQHKGSFPATPSRTVTISLTKAAAPFPYSLTGGPYYEGRLIEGGVDKGTVTLAWVSQFFRRATLEIDTLTGAVPPAPVPSSSGGTEFFDSIFARIGWQLNVINDQNNIPVPAGVTSTECWSSADLHALMTAIRNPATNLDSEWRIHLAVVPAKLGCARGVMYDSIGVPREACASFSDDGYPVADSSNFGTAQDQKQRDVPRAFLRSATHEVTHTLNQIHQEQETAPDNSIMTTTPSVADVLGGPTTGAPGVFPDQIELAHNTTVRHHLNHMPDPVIRPGGWPFASWFVPGGSPEASDRQFFSPAELDLTIEPTPGRIVLGQPVDLSWTLTNRSTVPLVTPNDVSTEALFTTITVASGDGREQVVRPFAIICDAAKLAVLSPGQSISATSRVFWSSAGFAFERPGRYQVTVSVDWSANGMPVSVAQSVDIFIEFPMSDADNEAAGLVLHPEVGKWVALGGEAYHLAEASRRLHKLMQMTDNIDATRALTDTGVGRPRLMAGFNGLLPNQERLAAAFPGLIEDNGNKDHGNGPVAGNGSRTIRKRNHKPE